MSKRPVGDILFKVAIISDTHVNEREDSSASPYPANAEANPRARHVFAQVNEINPAFVVHLGDMINPVPELPSYVDAAENFQGLAEDLKMPLHMVPGNHDIGDKPVSWMPAGMVCGEYIELYRKHFGKDYYAITHAGCHFIVINSPLINSGDPAEEEQKAWLEGFLAAHQGERMFLFSHYPIYITSENEPESYDNIGEPGRSWLLNLIRMYKPEAVFTAHVHNFWYDHIGDSEYYVTPSTCFVRHDYSEMYRIDGGDQQGRNDSAKLGYLTLDVHEKGHVAHYHRSYGANLADGSSLEDSVVGRPHVKTSRLDNIYVDMRHAWAEEMTVSPSGAVDEFQRKIARNDYPVMALWEMGVRGLRVPLQDIMHPKTRRRMELMAAAGNTFQVYLYGMPTAEETQVLADHAVLVEQLELVLGWDEVPSLTGEIRALKEKAGLRIVLSRVNRKDGAKHSGGKFNHLISHGFTTAECDELKVFLTANPDLVDGIQFTATRSDCPWQASGALSGFSKEAGVKTVLYIKSTEASPAQTQSDEIANTKRFADAVMAGIGTGVDVILDTLDDADRGYFTRTGLVDRRFNPRLASQVISAIAGQTSEGTWNAAEAGLLVQKGSGKTLRIAHQSETVGLSGTWICPRTGRTGLCGDETPAANAELILLEGSA
ncbi:metallophosphoesterase family protein [Leisingera sp. ANG-M1]|uniref:metallophosphoesterase family protein n=1 Tax=Leisingera sp. ANG-M1 TaxID=1577895 RepID=UPI00068FE802|nr:metallophosphoesterase [Leisingera sp. ANG-M1]